MSAFKEKWSTNLEFICSCIGYSVGLGNLWRFPYVAYKNGGSAFLVPYIIINVLIGRPIYYVELLLGQFSGQGPLGAFRMSPMFQGNAFGMMWGAFVTTIYYQMIITYAVLYLYHSFKSPLPWTDCYEWWGVPLEGCFARRKMNRVCANIRKSVVIAGINDTQVESPVVVTYEGNSVLLSQSEYNSRFAGCIDANASSVDMFYNRVVLNASSSFEKVGFVQPNLVICYAICWVIIFLIIFKGIKVSDVVYVSSGRPEAMLYPRQAWRQRNPSTSAEIVPCRGPVENRRFQYVRFTARLPVLRLSLSHPSLQVVGKVVLVTATAPYVILTVMLIRGITLPGASIGLRYLLVPQWDTLLSPTVWRAATEQTFYSLSIGTGGLLVYGGYQPFRNDMSSSVVFICFVDFLTSAFASLVVFSVLGNMAHTLDIPIADVVAAGPGLAFITYPEALSLIPFPNLWAVLFFAMLFFLGVDSQMGNCEFLTNSIQELFPFFAKKRSATAFMYCSFCFLIGLSLTTQAGLYVLTILDNYLGALIVLFTCLGEAIIVAWIYGMNRFCFDVTFMTGSCPSYFVVIAFKYCAPVVLGSFLVYSLYDFPRSSVGDYILPLWADLFGWALAVVGLAPLVIIAVVKLAQCRFSWRRAAYPETDWGPSETKYRVHYRERLLEVGLAELQYHKMSATASTSPNMERRPPSREIGSEKRVYPRPKGLM
ncbi:sodium-dependent proline transporter-like [Dermacentor andersoni]|uniref:sodium-dependent proline transporter-like n=1 Tax=Dermacentor andersoni TaxID=34620 RepID=UPI003B3BA871